MTQSRTTARESMAELREPAQLQRWPVRVRLRGGRTARGDIHVAASQSLVGFLATKKFFLNLTSARWEHEPEVGEPFQHLSLNTLEILWVEPLDGGMSLSTALSPTTDGRRVELHLVGGDVLDVTLYIASELRMSSYFESNPTFIPLWGVKGASDVQGTARIAVQHGAVLAIREV